MKTDKYGIEIKVGDYVLLDSYTGMEYGTSAGKIVQIKKNR
jgi:co-chaperonin GroES (HSP10)